MKKTPKPKALVQSWVAPDLKTYLKARAERNHRNEAGEIRAILADLKASESPLSAA